MKIWLVTPSVRIEGWEAEIAQVLRADGHEITARFAARSGKHDPGVAWRLADRIDAWIARIIRPRWCALVGLVEPGTSRAEGDVDSPAPVTGEKRPSSPDLVLDLAAGAPPIPSRIGTLRIRIGGVDAAQGSRCGFGPQAEQSETTSIQVIWIGAEGSLLLHDRRVQTLSRSWNLNYRSALQYLPNDLCDALRRLAAIREGPAANLARDFAIGPATSLRVGARIVGATLARNAATLIKRLAARITGSEDRYLEQWFLLAGPHDPTFQLRSHEPIYPPMDRVWADPFVLESDGEFVIVAEEMTFRESKGFISVIRRHCDGWTSTPIISAPTHLSYPFLFEHRGSRYLIPESSRSSTIPLYRMGRSVLDWTPLPPLMADVSAVDTSLIEFDGTIYLFTNVNRGSGECQTKDLHVFWATDFPTTSWHPHPQNPVCCDIRYARMGGGFLRRENTLFRVAQRSAEGIYGKSIEVMKIARLDREYYVESPGLTIAPDEAAGRIGMHHLHTNGRLMMADAKRRIPRPGRYNTRSSPRGLER